MVGILLEGYLKLVEKDIKVLNMYAPYTDWRTFWQQQGWEIFFKDPILIIGEKFNLVTSCREEWGKNSRMDALASFFSTFFEETG